MQQNIMKVTFYGQPKSDILKIRKILEPILRKKSKDLSELNSMTFQLLLKLLKADFLPSIKVSYEERRGVKSVSLLVYSRSKEKHR
jgi:hypothetical protein